MSWTEEERAAHFAAMKCDVCNRQGVVGVASSPFAAMSFAYCKECLQKPAEPELIFLYLWGDVANYGKVPLKPYIKQFSTWRNGAYISWDDWIENEKEGAENE